MDDDILKPIQSKALVRALGTDQPLPNPPKIRAVELLPRQLTDAAIASEARQALRERVDDDAPAMVEEIDRYLEDVPPLLQALRLAADTGDAQQLQDAADALKSKSATLGTATLYRLCQELKDASREGTTTGMPALVFQLKAEYERVEAILQARTRHTKRLRVNAAHMAGHYHSGVDDMHRPNILIVDDDSSMRQVLRRVMEKDGYQVVEAANGEQGLEVYRRLKPQLILLDALMPVMDGFACCTHLQQLIGESSSEGEAFAEVNDLNSIARTPVLMITGLDDQASVDRGSDGLRNQANSFCRVASAGAAFNPTISALSKTRDSESGVAASCFSGRFDRGSKPTPI